MDASTRVKPPFPKSTVALDESDTGMTREQFDAFQESLNAWERIRCYVDFDYLIRLANTRGFRKCR